MSNSDAIQYMHKADEISYNLDKLSIYVRMLMVVVVSFAAMFMYMLYRSETRVGAAMVEVNAKIRLIEVQIGHLRDARREHLIAIEKNSELLGKLQQDKGE